jgi:hypothetical protein
MTQRAALLVATSILLGAAIGMLVETIRAWLAQEQPA